jgi:hypothetical protein
MTCQGLKHHLNGYQFQSSAGDGLVDFQQKNLGEEKHKQTTTDAIHKNHMGVSEGARWKLLLLLQ